jgi:hypothetical protein
MVRFNYIEIPRPSVREVQKYLTLWNRLENYTLQEQALDKLFLELSPNNDNISDILLKVSTLNDFYSTNIFSAFSVAKHILNLNIDERLRKADITLVGDIQKVVIGGKEKNFYSFASKYCSHHMPLDFPIYDSYVDKILRYFNYKDTFSKFKTSDLKDYRKFKSVLLDFRSYYNLCDFNLKQIDQYLWQLGKEYFPRKY